MAVKRLNVSGSGDDLTTELIAPGDSRRVQSILLSNAETAADGQVVVSLLLETPSESGKAFDQFYIIRHVVIQGGASLLLDDPSLFKFSSEQGLYITCNSGNNIDVTIT